MIAFALVLRIIIAIHSIVSDFDFIALPLGSRHRAAVIQQRQCLAFAETQNVCIDLPCLDDARVLELGAWDVPNHAQVMELNIPGIHGPLYDLFRPQLAKYNVAVEAVAGNDLFNVVVDNEKTAALVIKHLQAKKAGRATLVPLARVYALIPGVRFVIY